MAGTGPWPGGPLWISPCLCGNSGREGGTGLSTGHRHGPACFPTQGHHQGSCVAHWRGHVSSVGGNSRLGTPPGTRSPWAPPTPFSQPQAPTSKSSTKKGPCHPGVPQDRARLRAVFSFLFLDGRPGGVAPAQGAGGAGLEANGYTCPSPRPKQRCCLAQPLPPGSLGCGGEAGPSFLHQRKALRRGS